MAAEGHISVRAIKGKFEQMQDATLEGPRSNQQKTQNSSGPLYSQESPCYINQDSLNSSEKGEISSKGRLSPTSRVRAQSLGNGFYCWTRNANTPGEEIVRDSNFSHGVRNRKFNSNSRNNNDVNTSSFSSFSEKQRLVESIVMNIRNSSVKKKEEERNGQEIKPKEMFSTKFEKDLKNVLERGVRRKWISKSKENQLSKEKLLRDQETGYQNGSHTLKPNLNKTYSKINSFLGVDLYPDRTCMSEDIVDAKEEKDSCSYSSYPICKSGSSPIMFAKSNNAISFNGKTEYRRLSISSQDILATKDQNEEKQSNHSGKVVESSSGKVGSSQNLSISNKQPIGMSPPRPPRRKTKKGKAPLPPFVDGLTKTSVASGTKLNISDHYCSQLESEKKPKCCTSDDRLDDSGFYSPTSDVPRSSWYEKFNYERQCDKNLEDETSLSNMKGNSIFQFEIDVSKNCLTDESEQKTSIKQNIICIPSLSKITELTALPTGEPPKKPPRTFAHDIYRSIKQDPEFTLPTEPRNKLTQQEIDSLYTKPLKRLKDKPPFSPRYQENAPMTKPAIAPKPADIISRSKQRFSVVEPLQSAVGSSEFSKPAIKRNSSFRFSLKKLKNSTPTFKLTGTNKECQIGRRRSNAKKDNEKRVRFPAKLEKDIIYNDVAGDPIYAVPSSKGCKIGKIRPNEEQKELHYMCSPLFHDDPQQSSDIDNARTQSDLTEGQKENLPPSSMSSMPSSPRQEVRFKLVDGLKEELRQSCRFVKKRLKGTNNRSPIR